MNCNTCFWNKEKKSKIVCDLLGRYIDEIEKCEEFVLDPPHSVILNYIKKKLPSIKEEIKNNINSSLSFEEIGFLLSKKIYLLSEYLPTTNILKQLREKEQFNSHLNYLIDSVLELKDSDLEEYKALLFDKVFEVLKEIANITVNDTLNNNRHNERRVILATAFYIASKRLIHYQKVSQMYFVCLFYTSEVSLRRFKKRYNFGLSG